LSSVLIVGFTDPTRLESSYARAFRKLGWNVYFWDPIEALHRSVRGSKPGRLLSDFINIEPWARKANLELLQIAQRARPALVLVIITEGVRAGTLGQLRAQLPNTLIYCLFPDTPHNLVPDRIQSLAMFDRVLTVSPAWVDTFERLGAKDVDYLPLAADTELHHPVSNTSVNGHDVVFIGNWRAEREHFLEQLTDFDLQIWGSEYWKKRTRKGSKLSNHWQGRQLLAGEFNWACSANRILLNIIDGVGWPGPNMRAFEQPACRAFSLVTRTPAITELFNEGKDIECFDSVEEARDKIEFYIRNENARLKIAENSYEAVVRGGHTYIDRATQLANWMTEDSRGHYNVPQH